MGHHGEQTYLLASKQVVSVTAAGFTAVEARIFRTSRCAGRTMTRGNMWYSAGAGAARLTPEMARSTWRTSVVESMLMK